MVRQSNHHSNANNRAAWLDAYGVTQGQAEVLVALIVARTLGAPLGCEPATRSQLAEFIGANQLSQLPDLERLGLVECVGMTADLRPQRWWFATDRACRLFGVQPPARVCGRFDEAAYQTEMSRRDERLNVERTRARKQRERQVA